MQPIVILANEFPWVMAPASLIAAMMVASLIRTLIQLTEKAFKLLLIGVMLALIGGALMVLLYIQ